MSNTEQLVDLGEVLTKEAIANAKKGQVYGFEWGGVITHYRVIRINKAKKSVWAEKTKLYTVDEAEKAGKFGNGKTN